MTPHINGVPVPAEAATRPSRQVAVESEADVRLRCAGMYGLLLEIIGTGALPFSGAFELRDRVKQACADHEAAVAARDKAARG